jgi:hypothetical protein
MAEPAFYRCKGCDRAWQRTEWKTRARPAICPYCASTDQETDQAREDAYVREVYGPITQHIGQLLDKRVEPAGESTSAPPSVLTAGIDMPSNATHHGALPLGVKWCTACERTDCAHTKEAGISPANQRQPIPVLRHEGDDSSMTRDKAHEVLHRFATEHEALHPHDSDAARAARLVLDEATHLRQLLRDLVDFDMGELPERDGLCAAEGPRQLERMERAWNAVLAEMGHRNQRRFYGGEP